MRQKAMESLGESQKRNRWDSEDSVSEQKTRKRRSKVSKSLINTKAARN